MIKENLYMGNHGDIFYINPSELHGMQSMTQDCLYLAFVFPFSWLQFERADEVSEKYLKPLATQSSYVVNCLPHKTAKDAASFFQEIASLYEGTIEGGWLTVVQLVPYRLPSQATVSLHFPIGLPLGNLKNSLQNAFGNKR